MSNSNVSVSGASWRTARACNGGSCIQVAAVDGTVAIRDSKDPSGPVLTYTQEEWLAFLGGAKDGDFDDLVRAAGTAT